MPKYQKIGKAMINSLIMNGWAFDKAIDNYRKYSNLNFGEDLLRYLKDGYVWSRPNFFLMAKPIAGDSIGRPGERGWFVQMLVGTLGELLTVVPCPLDFVAFCRNNDDDLRVIDFEKCVRYAARVHGYVHKEIKDVQ